MKILEKVLGIVLLIALILKFNLIAGADVAFFFAASILACIYYPFGFLFFNQIRLRHIFKKTSYGNTSAPKIIIAVVAGIGLSTICIGSLFKLFNYMGAQQMLLIGLTTTAFALLPSLIGFLKSRDAHNRFILWRMLIIGGIGSILMMTPPLAIVKLEYRDHPNYIQAYKQYEAEPENEELRLKLEMERNRSRLTEEEFRAYENALDNRRKIETR